MIYNYCPLEQEICHTTLNNSFIFILSKLIFFSCNTSSDSWNTSTSPVVFLSKPVNSLRNPNKRTPQRESYSNIMKQNCPANNELQPTPVKKAEPQNTTKSKPRKTKNNTAIIATSQHEDETSNDTNSEEKKNT